MRNRIRQTNHHEPKREEIAYLAYLTWEREGRPDGRDTEYWIQAETQLWARGWWS